MKLLLASCVVASAFAVPSVGSVQKCEDKEFKYVDGTFSDLDNDYEKLTSTSSTINDYLDDWTFPDFNNAKVDVAQRIEFDDNSRRPLDRVVLRFIHEEKRPEGNFTYTTGRDYLGFPDCDECYWSTLVGGQTVPGVASSDTITRLRMDWTPKRSGEYRVEVTIAASEVDSDGEETGNKFWFTKEDVKKFTLTGDDVDETCPNSAKTFAFSALMLLAYVLL